MSEERISTAPAAPSPSAPPARRPAHPGRGYSLFVTFAKLLLPTAAAGLVVLLVVWSQVKLDENRFRVDVTELAPNGLRSLQMTNARFEGVDAHDRPFSVTAETATQVDKQADTIDLTRPKADLTMADGAWVAINAEAGRYRRNDEQLDLRGGITVFHDRGFEFHASTVRVDLKAGTAVSDEPVQGQGPSGELNAQGFKITESGKRIEFTGRSKLILHGSAEGIEG